MEKPMINIAFVGHVDHGKSTLTGRLFYELGKIPENVKKRLDKHAEAVDKKTFTFAFFMDRTLEERRRGLTIELGFEGFETNDRKFNLIDAPGHKDFIKNMITGASEADVGILVVDTRETYQKGLQPQTKEHAILVYTLGVDQMLVVLNKMDRADFSQETYNNVKIQLVNYLEGIGYKGDINFIPCSAYYGENVTKKSNKMPWYLGPTFIEALNNLRLPERSIDKPFRMPILRTFKTSSGPVVAGKIESGKVKIGDRIVIVPYPGRNIMSGEIKSMEWQHNPLTEAGPGYDVGIILTRVEKGFVTRQIKKGYVIGDPNDPPVEAEKFKAKIFILDHPTSISIGYSPTIHCHQAVTSCSIIELEEKFDIRTGETIEEKPTFLKKNDGATVWIKPHKPLVIEEVSKIPRMGRFALRDMGRTIGAGMCIEIIPK